MSLSNLVIGADVGGTHITAALVDLQQRKILSSSVSRATVNAAGSAEEIIRSWSDCISRAKGAAEAESVCLAMPGPFDYEGGICLMRGQAKYESLYGLNVKERLAQALRLSPGAVFMDNDAACFLQGEVFGGAATDCTDKTVIGITLGTGLGSAVYRGGKSRSADRWRFPFKDGVAEDFLSTRWFVGRWKERTGGVIKGVKELASIAETDDGAKEIFREFGANLSQFLNAFIEKESPATVVIGGNIANALKWFRSPLRQLLAVHPTVKIARAALGEEAPLLGAAGGWLQRKTSAPSLS